MSDIAAMFAARVPRYTSYPTAPHFHAGVGAATYREWLAALPEGMPLSLYIHVPFCDTLCWFCGCNTTVVNSYSPVAGYLGFLEREIDSVAAVLKPGHNVTHVHFGGGSPTLLRRADLRRLDATLRRRFAIADDAEIAIEIDPRGFGADMAEAMRDIGVTRASIGLQDCDPVVQRAINRIQPEEVTANAVHLLRGVGINALNIDLIYGLPYQTVAGLERTIETALALDPDRLAIFGYAHVPHFKKHQSLIPEEALPGIAERLAQAEAAQAMLAARGYVPIGIDHFARPGDALAIAWADGRLARNFQGYTTDTAPALIGLGASSIGALPDGYVQNFADVPSWRAALLRGELPVAKGIALRPEDRMRRAVIERLMCDLEVDLDSTAAAYGFARASLADSLAALQPFLRDGIATLDGGNLKIPHAWRAATRLICAAFDTWLDAGLRKHAVAV
jgi:oxygen-independent coproporphyrinogen-3 oxidase